MKITAPKDFGNLTKKPLLPLVPDPVVVSKKEDLVKVDLLSDPNDPESRLSQSQVCLQGIARKQQNIRHDSCLVQKCSTCLRWHEH